MICTPSDACRIPAVALTRWVGVSHTQTKTRTNTHAHTHTHTHTHTHVLKASLLPGRGKIDRKCEYRSTCARHQGCAIVRRRLRRPHATCEGRGDHLVRPRPAKPAHRSGDLSQYTHRPSVSSSSSEPLPSSSAAASSSEPSPSPSASPPLNLSPRPQVHWQKVMHTLSKWQT